MIEARFTPFKKTKTNQFLFSYQKSDLLCVLMFCVSPPPQQQQEEVPENCGRESHPGIGQAQETQ